MSGDVIAAGRRTIELEAAALRNAAARLDQRFADAVALLCRTEGRIIVSGVGKSGIVARKIAATFTSTGTPASFLHPVDSLHGDLGIVGRRDVAIVLSKFNEFSGEYEHRIDDARWAEGIVGKLTRVIYRDRHTAPRPAIGDRWRAIVAAPSAP